MRWAVGGWTFFIAENALLSENRALVIDAVGSEERYHALYGTISTVACASIALGYHRIRTAGPMQWAAGAAPPASRLAACFALQAIGLAGLAQSAPKLQLPFARKQAPAAHAEAAAPAAEAAPPIAFSVRCPFDFAKHEGLHGAQRVSRHASLWSFAAVCLGAAAITPALPQAVCLAMPCAVALLGGAHHDSRQRRGMGGELPAELDAATSNVPMLALLSGAQGDVPTALRALGDETKWINAGLGAALAVLSVLRHVR